MPACQKFLLAALAFACPLAACAAAPAQDVPHYRLDVGQQLVYHRERTCRQADKGSWSQRHTDWKIDILSQNKDGSWHVAAVTDSGGTFHEKSGSSIPYERILEACACDLYPDGTIKGNDDPVVALSRLFPRLPADAEQLQKGWNDQTDDHARMVHFTLDREEGPGHVTFTSAVTGGVAEVFEPGSHYTYRFDPQTGIVDQVQLRSHRLGAAYTEKGKITLTAMGRLSPQIVSKIAALASENVRALAAYQNAIACDESIAAVSAAQAKLRQDGIALLDGILLNGEAGNASIKGATIPMFPDPPTARDILNAPVPDWGLKDLHGHAQSLKDFRGKILVLAFGSRTCPWCIREIPELIRLSKDFQGQPVAIIGIDVDPKASDAQFVVNALRIPYPVLLAPNMRVKYPVEGTPTVVIVDQNGIMRRRLIGDNIMGYYRMKAAIQSLLTPHMSH